MPDVAVNASAQLAAIGAKALAAGAGGLRLRVAAELRSGAQPMVPAARSAARARLSKHGGLNERVANQAITVSTRATLGTASVRLSIAEPAAATLDAGYVEHPVFGHPDRRVTQQLPGAAGWWSETLTRKGAEVVPGMVATMQSVAREIEAV